MKPKCVNEQLKEIVEERGIRQTFLVNKTGMSSDAISRILNSNRKITAEEFLSLCIALDVDPRSFFPCKTA